MASIFAVKNSGFTLLETAVVIMLLMIVITIVSIIYVNLTKAILIANDYYQALESVRLGTEKIWRILKYGWSFNVSSNQISFKKKDCTPATISFNNNLLLYQDGTGSSSVFDQNLVKVNNIMFAVDTPRTSQRYVYFQYAPKIIIIYYDLEIKSKKGLTSSLKFQQAVAPINSTYPVNLCP